MASTQIIASLEATCARAWPGRTVANGINTRYIGLVVFIYRNASFFYFNTQFFQANAFNIGLHTYSA